MPDLNSEDVAPVSFLKGGFTHGGQVHLDGTYAYLPKALAALTPEQQIEEIGDVYWEPGIRRGFPPASETYLAGEYSRRIARDLETSDKARASRANIDGEPVLKRDAGPTSAPVQGSGGTSAPQEGAPRIVTGGPSPEVKPLSDEELAAHGVRQPREDETVEAPSGDGGSLTDLTDDELVALAEDRGIDVDPTDRTAMIEALGTTETADPQADPNAEPFPGASKANIEDTRKALAGATDAEIEAFVKWERNRTDREPRSTLLNELES